MNAVTPAAAEGIRRPLIQQEVDDHPTGGRFVDLADLDSPVSVLVLGRPFVVPRLGRRRLTGAAPSRKSLSACRIRDQTSHPPQTPKGDVMSRRSPVACAGPRGRCYGAARHRCQRAGACAVTADVYDCATCPVFGSKVTPEHVRGTVRATCSRSCGQQLVVRRLRKALEVG